MTPAGASLVDSALAGLVLSLAVATQVSFVWAIRRFFVSPGAPHPGMRAIAGLGTLSAGLQLAALVHRVVVPPPFGAAQAAGLALFAAAFALFWAAVAANVRRPLTLAFSGDTPQHLVTGGPYGRVRHPFYTAYLLAWVAGALGAARPELLLSALVMGALYLRAAQAEEAKFANSPLADEYARYRQRTGLFWPAATRAPTRKSKADPARA